MISSPTTRGHNSRRVQGGDLLPHKRDFGGNVKTESGHLFRMIFPGAGFQPEVRFENFRRTLRSNPCPA
jgi:hypothetical protein